MALHYEVNLGGNVPQASEAAAKGFEHMAAAAGKLPKTLEDLNKAERKFRREWDAAVKEDLARTKEYVSFAEQINRRHRRDEQERLREHRAFNRMMDASDRERARTVEREEQRKQRSLRATARIAAYAGSSVTGGGVLGRGIRFAGYLGGGSFGGGGGAGGMEAAGGLGAVGELAGGPLGIAAMAVAAGTAVVVSIGKKIAERIPEFLGKATSESEWRRGMVADFGATLGSNTAGEQFFRRLSAETSHAPVTMAEMAPIAQRMMHLKGLHGMRGQDAAIGAIRVMNDLVAGAGATPAKYKEFSEFFFKGMQGAPMRQSMWASASRSAPWVNYDAAIRTLADHFHISRERAEFLLSAKNKDMGSRGTAFVDVMTLLSMQRSAAYGGGIGTAGRLLTESNATVQWQQLTGEQGGLSRIFQGVNTEKFAQGLARINEQLSEGSPRLREFQGIIDSTFQSILRPWLNRAMDPKKLDQDMQAVERLTSILGKAATVVSNALRGMTTAAVTFIDSLPHNWKEAAGWIVNPVGNVSMAAGAAVTADLASGAPPSPGLVGPSSSSSLVGPTLPAPAGVHVRHAGHRHAAAVHLFDALPAHAAGGVTLSDHLAQVHRDEIILPLPKAAPILGEAMDRARESGRGGRASIVVNVAPGAVVLADGDESTAQRLEASLVPLLGSALERATMQFAGSLG